MLNTILELLFPASCLACGDMSVAPGKIMLCTDCLSQVEIVAATPLCSCCGRNFPVGTGGNRLCDLCLTNKYHFNMARALVRYHPPVVGIISSYKYHGQTTALESFRAILNDHPCRKELGQPDMIIPVPLHVKRLRQRGFNQSLLLARAFYPDHQHIINFKALQRIRHTSPQTGMNGRERRRNMKNAFQVVDTDIVRGKKIILVDDVFTTGTTVNECALVLKKAGAKEVLVLTLARVD